MERCTKPFHAHGSATNARPASPPIAQGLICQAAQGLKDDASIRPPQFCDGNGNSSMDGDAARTTAIVTASQFDCRFRFDGCLPVLGTEAAPFVLGAAALNSTCRARGS